MEAIKYINRNNEKVRAITAAQQILESARVECRRATWVGSKRDKERAFFASMVLLNAQNALAEQVRQDADCWIS